ncbi:MAG: hypothetical protein D6795_21145 [Deltaproteobacteria bacterium]|nr:MAG: hypothetical protein D6795_21145 [Deltaproteobacteria bacterium]
MNNGLTKSLCDVRNAIQAQQTDGDVTFRETVCLKDDAAFTFGGPDPFNPANIPGFTLGLDADYWAVHLQGDLVLQSSGDVRFRLVSTDDDAIVFVNQQPLVADLIAPTSEPLCASEISQGKEASITLSAGTPHRIDIIFYEKRGNANFNLQVLLPGESDFRNLKATDLQNETCPEGFF